MAVCKDCGSPIKDNGLMFCSLCRKERAERLGISLATARNYERRLTQRAADGYAASQQAQFFTDGNLPSKARGATRRR